MRVESRGGARKVDSKEDSCVACATAKFLRLKSREVYWAGGQVGVELQMECWGLGHECKPWHWMRLLGKKADASTALDIFLPK